MWARLNGPALSHESEYIMLALFAWAMRIEAPIVTRINQVCRHHYSNPKHPIPMTPLTMELYFKDFHTKPSCSSLRTFGSGWPKDDADFANEVCRRDMEVIAAEAEAENAARQAKAKAEAEAAAATTASLVVCQGTFLVVECCAPYSPSRVLCAPCASFCLLLRLLFLFVPSFWRGTVCTWSLGVSC